MKTTYTLNGKKITKKALKELIGDERVTRATKEALELLREDPLIDNSLWTGHGMLRIQFN